MHPRYLLGALLFLLAAICGWPHQVETPSLPHPLIRASAHPLTHYSLTTHSLTHSLTHYYRRARTGLSTCRMPQVRSA